MFQRKKGVMAVSSYGIAALCFGIMTGLYLCYQAEKFRKKGNKKRELALKGGTTLTAALLAGYGYAMAPTPAHLMIMMGLFVCAVADVVLDRHFLAGTVAFGLGHICYCAANLMSARPGMGSLILFLVMAGIMISLYPKLKQFSAPNSAAPYLGYALLISAMLALALPQKPMLLAGAALFVASDCMLLYRMIRKLPSRAYDYICLGAYFLAQFLIAASTVV